MARDIGLLTRAKRGVSPGHNLGLLEEVVESWPGA
jgi:hypothetical protein